jgi:hypothetical protein
MRSSRAQAFLDANYPNLKSRLEDVEFSEVFSSIPCVDPAQPMVIPIFIPAG